MTRVPPPAVVARRRVAHALLIAAVLAAACAAPRRPPVLPAPVVTPRFPEFIYPAPPARLGAPLAAAEHEIGWQWLQSGELRNAERSFAAVLKTVPQFYPAEAGLGFVALAKKDHREAASHFDRALAADASYAPALAGRGEALLALGQRDQALTSFEAAVAADPKLTDLRGRIGVLRFRGMQDDVDAARRAAEAGRLAEAQTIYERSLAASPDSPFLYRELAAIERRIGNLEAALRHAEKAVELSPAEPRNFVTLGEIYEAQGAYANAADALGRAAALEPGEALDRRIDELREKAAFAGMPQEYRAIEAAPTVTRAQLAALFGVRLDDLLKRARRTNPVVMTDTRGNWAGPWIQAVSRAGIMDPYPNHTFQPGAVVRRADLALGASRALSLMAAERPRQAAAWRDARVRFADLPPGHLSYPAASVAVQSGVMGMGPDATFQLSRPVTGAEALAAIRKLEELSGRRPR
ncbi:MAG: tetratricopeptide repeat protein [Acidobacteriota bacterium]|nr:tetratricopeptide repeat protein [Acidobacteriota bacterium]